jgi:hypothetical protein
MKTAQMIVLAGLGTLVVAGTASAQVRNNASSWEQPTADRQPSASPRSTATDEQRHSGRVTQVTPDGREIKFEEMLSWKGPGTAVVERTIEITPRTAVQLVERTPEWTDDQPTGWESRMLKPSDLRPGDFVTVTGDCDHRGAVVALQVIRPRAP